MLDWGCQEAASADKKAAITGGVSNEYRSINDKSYWKIFYTVMTLFFYFGFRLLPWTDLWVKYSGRHLAKPTGNIRRTTRRSGTVGGNAGQWSGRGL